MLEAFAGSVQPPLHYFSSAKASGIRLSDAMKPFLLVAVALFS
jgi:hypothetical protein